MTIIIISKANNTVHIISHSVYRRRVLYNIILIYYNTIMSRRKAKHTHTHTHCIINFSHRSPDALPRARTVSFYTTRVCVCECVCGEKQINIKHYYYRFADGNVLRHTADQSSVLIIKLQRRNRKRRVQYYNIMCVRYYNRQNSVIEPLTSVVTLQHN